MSLDIKRKAVSGVKWTTGSTIVLAISGILKLSILTRFLDKADFGLMAIVLFVLGFMELFMDMGLSMAILHKQNISKNEYSSLYWLNAAFSILLYGIVLSITPVISDFYSEPELLMLLPLMGTNLLISAIGRQFQVIEQKNLNFKRLGLIEILTSILSLIAAIVLAMNNYGVYSLVYSSILKFISSNVLYLIIGLIHGNKICFRFKFEETKPFLKMGMYQTGGQMVNYFNRDLDILLIGKFFGAEILGSYSLAKQLVLRPYSMINPILTRVAAPVLTKFQGDIESLKKNYLRLTNLISTINIPVYLGLIIFAPIVVEILYGSEFQNLVALVRILSVCMMIRSVGNPVGSLIVATGRTDLEFYWNIFTLAVMPLAIIVASKFSIEWVAISITGTMALLIIPSWWFLTRKMIAVNLSTYLFWLVPRTNIFKLMK